MPKIPKEDHIPKAEYKAQKRAELQAVIAAAPDDMRLVEFAVKDVMKIKFAHLKPKGNVIVVGGRNGQGKSSLLQAIGFLLCGGDLMPTDVIRAGQKTATIQGRVGPFTITRYFTRKEPEEGRSDRCYLTKIKVTGAMGEEYRRRTELLELLLEQLSFDPLAFMRMEAKEQFAALKGMAKFEVDIDALDALQAVDYDARREAKYLVDAVAARLKPLLTEECPVCHGNTWIEVQKTFKDDRESEKMVKRPCVNCREFGGVAPAAPEGMGDAGALAKRLEEAAEHNARVGAARGEKEKFERWAARTVKDAEELRMEALAKLEQALSLDGRYARFEVQTEPSQDSEVKRLLEQASSTVIEDEIDTAAVSAELAAALAGSKAIEQAKRTAELSAEYDAALASWTELQERMKARKLERDEAMQTAQMPIEGLAIGDGEVFYQGLPFNQASGAEQIRVSLAIGMASNPKLRILRFMDGGWDMLDEDSQQLVRAEVEKHKYQLWAEHVGGAAKCEACGLTQPPRAKCSNCGTVLERAARNQVTVLMEDGTATGDDVVETL